MKKCLLVMVCIVFTVALVACGESTETEVKEATKPTQTAEPTQEPTQEPTPDLNADPMNVVRTVLNDPQVIFGEDTAAMTENCGGYFGNVAIKQPSEDGSYYQFISNDDGAYMIGNLNFLDLGEFRENAQAVLIKFQPENADELFFTMFGNGEIILNFQNNQPYFNHVQDGYSAPYSDYMPTNLTLQNDKWYWALMAFDSNGNYRSLVWEDGRAEERAYCAENMGEWHNDYKDSNWHLTIGFGANQTLNIEQYNIMDFDGFIDEETSNDNQEDDQNDASIPTISGLGLDQGNYINEEDGVSINIQSTAWGGAEKDVINCTVTLYDTEFGVIISYPEKIYEIHFGDELWYQYDPVKFEIIDPWFDVDAELSEMFGDNADGLSDEIVTFIDSYCMEKFGYKPEELIMMMYE
ncbi:MAG: hypothetical protein PHO15_02070 [Eubacteriales bacterium]|nr:hypothetical protein [Eubacteriales bacterium]